MNYFKSIDGIISQYFSSLNELELIAMEIHFIELGNEQKKNELFQVN